ncbi:fimbrillin family protein [uncultured Alistipes sp.]|jgi:hypothetical protein|uniref:fimbrillin family protein n=1 Tax=uncultured Alistipes sp. TaxID=538949 RepID=UPI0025F3F45B|nr:fimbrillin family protein [uncultured Alistipes sp.]
MATDFIRRLIVPLALGTAALLASCSHDNTEAGDGPTPGGGDEIRFEIGIAQTRVSTGADFRSEWINGDQIGIFAVQHGQPLTASGNYIHNVKMTYNGSTWSLDVGTKLWWPGSTGKLDFYAYYPYDDNSGDPSGLDPTNLTFAVQSDQRNVAGGVTKNNYDLSDLLKASADNDGAGYGRGDGTVTLQFSHALALVQVELAREMNVPFFDPTFAVKLTGVQPSTKLNWSGVSTGTGTTTDIRMNPIGNDIYRALVPAQTLADDMKVTFVQTTSGSEIDMEYHGLASATLTAGKVAKHKVTLGWGIDPDHKYKVGDPYPSEGAVMGVVCWLDTSHPDYDTATQSGTYGKIVSLDEGSALAWGPGIDEHPAVEGIRSEDDGYTATRNLIALRSGSPTFAADYPAFGWIWRKNGSQAGEWYMPAAKEFGQIYTDFSGRIADFNAYLLAAGGEPLLFGTPSIYYWLSTERPDVGLGTSAMVLKVLQGTIGGSSSKSHKNYVRAFRPFGTPQINTPPAPLPDGYYKVGDYWPDRNVTFSAPGVVRKGTAPVGIVCRIDPASSSDGGATGTAGNVISLDEGLSLSWGPDYTDESTTAPNIRSETDGYTATREMIAVHSDDQLFADIYSAFNWIWHKNGSQQGEWYIPAATEFRGFFTNTTAVNASMATAGGSPLGTPGQYWSSTEADQRTVRDPSSDMVANFKTGAKYVRAARKF